MKIMANGEIVQDDDPRVQGVRQPSSRRPTQDNVQQPGQEATVVSHGPDMSVFERLNSTLASWGVPIWNLGPYPVQPIVSAGFVLSLVLMGFKGLLFSGALFLLANYSGSSGGSGFRMPDLSSIMGGPSNQGASERRNNFDSQSRQQSQPKPTSNTPFSGPGYKLD